MKAEVTDLTMAFQPAALTSSSSSSKTRISVTTSIGGGHPEPPLASPNLLSGIKSEDDRAGEVRLEEVGKVRLASDGEQSSVELSSKANDVGEKANVTANDIGLGLVRQLLHVTARVCPALAEANVREVDAAPDEEVGKTSQRQESGEEDTSGSGQVDKGKPVWQNLIFDTAYLTNFADSAVKTQLYLVRYQDQLQTGPVWDQGGKRTRLS